MSIKVGDVVIVVGEHEKPVDFYSLHNMTGVVVSVAVKNHAGVEFDDSFPGGHNLQGLIASKRGWNVPKSSLVKLQPVKDVIKSFCIGEKKAT